MKWKGKSHHYALIGMYMEFINQTPMLISKSAITTYCTLKCALNIYYCMTGRAIWGNIQFEGGSIGPTAGRDNT